MYTDITTKSMTGNQYDGTPLTEIRLLMRERKEVAIRIHSEQMHAELTVGAAG